MYNIRNAIGWSALLVVSLVFVLPAQANTTNKSFDPVYAEGPFIFYCTPYIDSFVPGGTYDTVNGPCVYSVPLSLVGEKKIAVYLGTVGSSIFVAGDVVIGDPTLVQEDLVSINSITEEQDLFGIIYQSDIPNFETYLQSGGTPPDGAVQSVNYYLIPWKKASHPDTGAPIISILTPLDGHTYLTTDTVLISAEITDPEGSGISQTAYSFNGMPVDPLQPLPLGIVPTGPAIVEIYASDIFGNIGYSISNFIIEAPTVVDTQPPTITITSPLKYGLYERANTVFLTANVSDTSPLATTTYWFNGKKINPAQKLTFNSSTPPISKVAVSATDTFNNTATSTLTFFVVKNKNSCLMDIIAIYIAYKNDGTLPDKPTLQNLIASCAALLKGHHHWNWH